MKGHLVHQDKAQVISENIFSPFEILGVLVVLQKTSLKRSPGRIRPSILVAERMKAFELKTFAHRSV